MESNMYVVAICGYEGIETILGFFDRHQAYEMAKKLKENAPDDMVLRGKDVMTDEELHEYYAAKEAIASKVLGFDTISSWKADQVCVMSTRDTIALECICDDIRKMYPDFPGQVGGTWWR